MSNDEQPDGETDGEREDEIGDPYRHLLPLMKDKVGPGRYVSHGDATLRRVDSERNLWDLIVDDTVVVSFDPNQWPTTVNLGIYVDTVLKRLENLDEEEEADPHVATTDNTPGAFQ